MRMGIGLGVGINRSNYAQGIFNAYSARVVADGGVVESGSCVDAVSSLLQTASLLLIPSGYKANKLYSEIPTNGNGDLTWTRTSTANRTNSSGLLESMGTGVPRLSYMYGSCPSALLEPQRTNLVLQSQDFDNVTWLKLLSSVTANQTTSPDGSTNADKLFENATNGFHSIYQLTSNATGLFTLSCYAKSSERNWLILDIFTGATGGGDCLAWFDLNNGVVGSTTNGSGSSSTTSTIQSVGNGWYRCSITVNKTSATAGNASVAITTGNNISNYAGNSSNGLFIYGAQLEAGAYPTTYIPTTSATATRVADSFSRNNIYTNGLITSSGGTWFVELRNNVGYTRDAGVFGLFLANDINSNTGFRIKTTSGTLRRLNIFVVINGSEGVTYLTTTDNVKIAIKWNGSTADVFVNGTKEVSATAFTATALEFLAHATTGDVPKFIQQMALFNSPLTDAQCQTLTTL